MSHDYLMSARQLEGAKFTAEPGPVQYVKVPRQDLGGNPILTYGPEHIIPRDTWVAEIQGLADGDGNPHSISPAGDVLIFVHGYNNAISEVLRRTRDLRQNLQAVGWRGEVVAFDWPSGNSVLNYLEDRQDATAVAGFLVEGGLRPLIAGQQAGCVTNVHLLGHSTGAYVIQEAFTITPKTRSFYKTDWKIGQVALIAADISLDNLSAVTGKSTAMFERIDRLTNYSNGHDAVLAVSNAKRVGVAPRLGRKGLPPDAPALAVNVDCTRHFAQLGPKGPLDFSYTHSWHFTDSRFALDLAMTLEGATDRAAIPSRSGTEPGLWLNEDGQRPPHQAHWGIKEAARYLAPREV